MARSVATCRRAWKFRKIPHPLATAAAVFLLLMAHATGAEWGRFRGPNGTGVSNEKQLLPEKIGPDKNLIWKTDIPAGISSPVIGGGRAFVTTVDGAKLGTMALDVNSGAVLWRVDAPTIHKTKGKRLATTSPVTDGAVVISFFETCGLLCYDMDGRLQWSKDFGPIKNQFNHASSPILVDDRLIHVVDHDGESVVVALDKKSGQVIWRCHRFVFGRNYASPVIWSFGDRRFVVVTGSGLVTGHDLQTGTPVWYIRATAAVVNPTPVVSADQGMLFVHSSSPSSGAKSSPFRYVREGYDENDDGALQETELPDSFLKAFFAVFDKNKSGGIDEQEYSRFEDIAQPFVKGMVAIRSGGSGDLTKTNVAWTQPRSMPRTPSAICHEGVLYIANEGGVLQSFDANSGDLIHKGRIDARGTIYSSPALGDGKIYIGTRDGQVAVVSADGNWKNLHAANLGGEIQASPAIADGRVYFRTDKAIYCFGLKSEQ